MNGWEIKTILLAYDGSEGAKVASGLAGALAVQNEATVVVATAFHWSYSLDVMGEQARRVADEAEATAQAAVERLQAQGVDVLTEVLEGQAGEVVLRAAAAHSADLIVVGRRGHGPTVALLLGSVSEYVVRRAKMPVLVAH